MGREESPAAAPVTWGLAVLFVIAIDAGITRSSILWGPTAFENTRNLSRLTFAQTYRAARKIYATERGGARRIAVLGNSRIFIPAQEPYVERELARIAPALDLSYANLAVFGAGLGDLEVLSRHLAAYDPALVIAAIACDDLLATRFNPIQNVPSQLLRIGWRDGPIPPGSVAERIDRWGRTVWPLYRFREFTRAALIDRLFPEPDAGPFPAHFDSTRALFDYMHGARGGEAEAAYQAWRRDPTIERFVAYLQIGSAGHLEMVRGRVRDGGLLNANGLTVRVLDRLMTRLGNRRWKALVLVMPENPLLEQDVTQQYHRVGFSDRAFALIRDTALPHGVTVVDARHWMPREAFIDFDHVMPDLSGFQRPFAEEIVRALESQS